MLKVDFGKMQQEIYKFTINKLFPGKKNSDIRENALETASATDQFFVYEFDEVLRSFERKSNYDDVMENLENAVMAIREAIDDWYGNPWNFGPGEEPKVTVPEIMLRDKALKALINTISPEFKALAEAAEKERKKELAERNKKIAADFKKNVPALLALIAKHDDEGWNRFHALINKSERDYNEIEAGFKYILRRARARDELAKKLVKSRTPVSLKNNCRFYFSPIQYTDCVMENLYFVKNEFMRAAHSYSSIRRMVAKAVQKI